MKSERVSRKDPRLIEINRVCFPGEPLPASRRVQWYLAENAAGFCGIEKRGQIAYLTRSGVLPEYRRQGGHLMMLRYRIWIAKYRMDAVGVRTYTHVKNLASVRNLIRAKFLPVKTHGDYILWYRALT